jgi:hypothetical protein
LELETPDGALVTEQVNATVPVNELVGVTVMIDVPLLPALELTVMLVGLLERLKLVPPPGACQKSPQPARSVAAANNPAHVPIFIAAPLVSSSGCVIHRNPITDYTYTRPIMNARRKTENFRLLPSLNLLCHSSFHPKLIDS